MDHSDCIHDHQDVEDRQLWDSHLRNPVYRRNVRNESGRNRGRGFNRERYDGFGRLWPERFLDDSIGTGRLSRGCSAQEGPMLYERLHDDYYLSDDPGHSGMAIPTIDFERRFFPDDMGW